MPSIPICRAQTLFNRNMHRLDLGRDGMLEYQRSEFTDWHKRHALSGLFISKNYMICSGCLPGPLPERLFHRPQADEWDEWHQDVRHRAQWFQEVFRNCGDTCFDMFEIKRPTTTPERVEQKLLEYESISGKGRISLFSGYVNFPHPENSPSRRFIWCVLGYFLTCYLRDLQPKSSEVVRWLDVLDLFEFPPGLDFSDEVGTILRKFYSGGFYSWDKEIKFKNKCALRVLEKLDELGIGLGGYSIQMASYNTQWESKPENYSKGGIRNTDVFQSLERDKLYPDFTEVGKRLYAETLLEVFTHLNTKEYDEDFYPKAAKILTRHMGDLCTLHKKSGVWTYGISGLGREACMFLSSVNTFPFLLPIREEPRNIFGTTPLMMAASRTGSFSWLRESKRSECQGPKLVNMMIDAGCDIEARDNYDRTVLAYIVSRTPGTRDLGRVLIDRGADVNALGTAPDGIRRSVLDHAFYTAFMWFFPKPYSDITTYSHRMLLDAVEDIKFYLSRGARLCDMSSMAWKRGDRESFNTFVNDRLYGLFHFAWIASQENCNPVFFVVDRAIVDFL